MQYIAVRCCTQRFLSRPLLASTVRITHRMAGDHTRNISGMELGELMRRLNRFADASLAAGWDNTGLLVEPSPPHVVQHLLLTNDLTAGVLVEAVALKANMILSYHPPIFTGLKKLTQGSWKERNVIKCVENRIAVYSPHTILDSVAGGVTDWLISPYGGKVEPIRPSLSSDILYSVTATLPGFTENMRSNLSQLCSTIDAVFHGYTDGENEGSKTVAARLTCKKKHLPRVVSSLSAFCDTSNFLQVTQLTQVPREGCGDGRITRLDSPMTLREAVERTKAHLKLTHVRLALAVGTTLDSKIQSVAVCAGSGGSVLAGVKSDLYVTGEMSHHEVLDACHQGASVILCEHSNTERGYLHVLATKLDKLFDEKIKIDVSSSDRDPLEIV